MLLGALFHMPYRHC
uniref:Uncharacterized protein n=1 Tax=Rhizophora mucronata TaxID=61149 RepID=A0A2P2PP85_RHIMU